MTLKWLWNVNIGQYEEHKDQKENTQEATTEENSQAEPTKSSHKNIQDNRKHPEKSVVF